MDNYLEHLNQSQSAAVTQLEGPMMVIAGPGSGKTRVLTYRIAHLITSGTDSFNILALTFTNKAAKEMRNRIESIVESHEARNLWITCFSCCVFQNITNRSRKSTTPPTLPFMIQLMPKA